MACPAVAVSAASTAFDMLMGKGSNCISPSVRLNSTKGNKVKPTVTPSSIAAAIAIMFTLRPMDHLIEGGKAMCHLQLSLRRDSHKRSYLFLFRFQCFLVFIVFILHQAHSNDRAPDLLLDPMGRSHLTLRLRNDRSS